MVACIWGYFPMIKYFRFLNKLKGGKTVIIREANKEDLFSIAKVHVDSNRSADKGVMPDDCSTFGYSLYRICQ